MTRKEILEKENVELKEDSSDVGNFGDWKAKHDDEIVNVATVFFNYERGVDTKTCYDELEWLLRKAYVAGQNHCNSIHTDNSKIIEELEKSNKETQELLDKQIEATYKLDKENADLKVGKDINVFTDNTETFKNALERITELEQKMIKAKEIIEVYLKAAIVDGLWELQVVKPFLSEIKELLKK